MHGTGWVALIVAVAAAALVAAVKWLKDDRWLLLAAAVVLSCTALAFASVKAPRSGTCDDVRKPLAEERTPAGKPGPSSGVTNAAPLELAPDSDTTIDFRLRREVRHSSVFLQRVRHAKDDPASVEGAAATQPPAGSAALPTLPDAGTRLSVAAVGFERTSGDFQLDPGHVWADAVVRRNGDGVRLTVCIDPNGVPAGSYKGSVVFDDTRVSAGAVQWRVTLQYEKWWLVAYAALLVALAAFFYSYSTALSDSRADLRSYAVGHIIGIAAGLGTATVAFLGVYTGAPDWGGKADDWLKGAGVVFAAFTTGFIAQRMRLPTPARQGPPPGDGGAADEQPGVRP